MKFRLIFHYICYYSAWILGITYVVKGHGWLATWIVLGITVVQIGWEYFIRQNVQGLTASIFIFTLAGFVVDSVFVRSGLIFFYENPWMPYWTPPWMVSLWISFAVAFYTLMQHFLKRYLLLGVLAFFAYPFFYYAGLKLGVGLLPFGDASILIYCIWGVLLPFCMYVYNRSVS